MGNTPRHVLVSLANDAKLILQGTNIQRIQSLTLNNMKMKLVLKIMWVAALAAATGLTANRVSAQTVLARWTFETSQPGVVDGPAVPGPGNWITNIAAEVGSGTAAGWHSGFGTPTYSSPAGNGSAHSFSSNGWTNNPGDFYQFAVSTTGYTNIIVTYDQISSSTGPGYFYLAYGTDGVNFSQFGTTYIVSNAPVWSAGSANSAYSHTNNLGSITTITNQPIVYFRIVDASNVSSSSATNTPPGTGTVGTAGTDRIDNFTIIGTSIPLSPDITGISPSSATVNAGNTAAFTLAGNFGNPVASNYWYQIVGSTTNPVTGATTTTLTLNNVLAANAGDYFAVLSNSLGSSTSGIASLTVIDPFILAEPANTYGLLDGTVQFTVTAAATSPGYQWYFADTSGNIIAPVSNGTRGDGSGFSGAMTSTLTFTNLQLTDPTNFVVVVTGTYGAVTSSVASLLAVANTAILAFWDFNGNEFTNLSQNPDCVYYPASYLGDGTATAVGTPDSPGDIFSLSFSPFVATTTADPADGPGFDQIIPGVDHLPNFSWGTTLYPASGNNKLNGVQFKVSTVGAKNIRLSYDSRVSPTASDYERVQYTTNGTDWIDYPSSSTFGGVSGSGAGGWLSFNNNLTGFPGVANNPNFGLRIVTEYQSTATYGIGTTNNYVGAANTYGAGGTVTYDLIGVFGDAITNNNMPPTVSGFMDTNTVDYIPVTNHFMVSDDTTPPDSMTYSAVSLNPSTVSPSFAFSGSGPNRTLIITPNSIRDSVDAAPILVTVTDANGDSTAAWFLLTLTSQNLPPTNSLTRLQATNTLANTPITIPFTVGDDRTSVASLTYSVASDNNTLIPSANVVVTPNGAAPTVTITPAANQPGVGVVSVTVNDNDTLEPKSTTANIAFMVRPNTNVVAIDYFNYDNSGSLDTVGAGFWQHLTGVFGQLQVGSGAAAVDTSDDTENLQTTLLGGPYSTNGGAVLYASYIVNMDPAKMPVVNGTYFTVFNDGSGATGPYECRVVAATNGAAPGYYQIGINNFNAANGNNSAMFPQDLAPASNYVVVTSLVVSNGFSTLWINPSSQSSPSVADTTPAPSSTNLYNIADFELRESGGAAGSIGLSYLKVGTTFDSVLPSLHVQPVGTNVIVNWSDPTLGIQSTTNLSNPFLDVPGATPPYTNNASANSAVFFRFKR